MREAIYPNFVLNKSRNRRPLSKRASSFIELSSTTYRFLNQFPKLDFYDCRELSQIIRDQEPDGPKRFNLTRNEARDLFISSNLKLVRDVACNLSQKYSEVSPEDLFQMGVIGLMKAVDKWDPEREFLFSTYATWWILQSISRETSNTSDEIRIPIHMSELKNRIANYHEQYLDFFGRMPEAEEASDSLEISVEQYIDALNAFIVMIPLKTITTKFGELRERPALSTYAEHSNLDPYAIIEGGLLVERISQILSDLSEREREVIKMRYGIGIDYPATLTEIGDKYGVTRERIRQIESKVMSKLHYYLENDPIREFLEIETDAIGHQFELTTNKNFNDYLA